MLYVGEPGEQHMTYYQFIFTLLLSQAIVIMITIVSNLKRKNLSYVYLALFFLNLLILAVAAFLYLQKGLPGLMKIGGIYHFSFIGLGPLLYIFLRIQLIPNYKFGRKDTIHFIPIIFGFFAAIPVSQLSFEERFDILYQIFPQNLLGVDRAIGLLIYLSYSIACYRFISLHRQNLKEITSDSRVVEMRWAQLLVGIFISLWFLNMAIMLSRLNIIFVTIGLEFLVLAFFAVAFFSFHYSRVFVPTQEDEHILAVKHNCEMNNNKYRTSPLTSEQISQYTQKLIHIIHSKPDVFLQSDFQLSSLAKLLGLPSYLTSQVINEGMGKNFYELVNEQRIRHAQKALESSQGKNQSILEVAYDVGFNSKSTFNQSFKKYVGTTPSEYRRSFL